MVQPAPVPSTWPGSPWIMPGGPLSRVGTGGGTPCSRRLFMSTPHRLASHVGMMNGPVTRERIHGGHCTLSQGHTVTLPPWAIAGIGAEVLNP